MSKLILGLFIVVLLFSVLSAVDHVAAQPSGGAICGDNSKNQSWEECDGIDTGSCPVAGSTCVPHGQPNECTCVPPFVPPTPDPVTFQGFVYDDKNKNGVFNSGVDGRLGGRTVALKNSSGSTVATDNTNSIGEYFISYTPSFGSTSTYTLTVNKPSSVWEIVSSPGSMSAAPGDGEINRNFFLYKPVNGNGIVDASIGEECDGSVGVQSGCTCVDYQNECGVPATASVQICVNKDADGDGAVDGPFPGVSVLLERGSAGTYAPVGSGSTDSSGCYIKGNLEEDNYRATQTAVSGYVPLGSTVQPISLADGESAVVTFIQQIESTTTDPGDPTDPPAGVFTIDPLNFDNTVTGTVTNYLDIPGADYVKFYWKTPGTTGRNLIGPATRVPGNEEKWQRVWDTSLVPTGDKFIFAEASSADLNYAGDVPGGKLVTVVNDDPDGNPDEVEEQVEEETEDLANQEEEILTLEELLDLLTADTLEETVTDVAEEPAAEEVEEFVDETQAKIDEIAKATDDEVREALVTELAQEAEAVESRVAANTGTRLNLKDTVEELIKEAEEVATERKVFEETRDQVLSRDTDGDSLPDHEEIRLGTNPVDPDSDNDGFLDGSEVALQFDPLDARVEAKVKFEDPRKVAPRKEDIFTVERVEAAVIDAEADEPTVGVKLQGKALPHTFVTIYIYSLPTIVVTKADAAGSWEYVLDSDLEDGEHTVYVAITDNRGEIAALSNPFDFAKRGDSVFQLAKADRSFIDSLQKNFAILIVALIIFSFGVALTVIGFHLTRKGSSQQPGAAA